MHRTLGRAFTLAFALSVTGALAGCTATTPDDSSAFATAELGTRAPDATGMGPQATTNAEYRVDASVDPDVIGDRETELWAHVYRPASLGDEKHPLLVFLHGNHGTCGRGTNPRVDDNTQYTTQGTCPSGYVVTPNHLGYAYVAERLASWGYIVVSINANRGITAGGGAFGDSGLNLARGRLVLKHLQRLSEWNAQPGTTPSTLGVDLAGKIDFRQVGMMGHSRGGEGVRAAYTQYHDQGSPWPARIQSPLDVRAIFEIGPVDGQTTRQLNAFNTAWNVLLPMCDGDVSSLQGMRPFDRMLSAAADEARPTPKAMFAVWGANHNYYNTEWQTSDSRGCRGDGHTAMFQSGGSVGSEKQRTTGLHGMMGFFRAHVGANAQAGLNNMYNPMYQVPETLEAITHIERAYADAARAANVQVLENFTQPAGTSLSGQPTIVQNVTVTHGAVSEHDAVLRAANIKWTTASSDNVFEVPFDATDASTMKTIDFRLSRQNPSPSSTGPLDFSVRLVNADGTTSAPLKLADYVGVAPWGGHATLETARLPLADFPNANLVTIKGVRFVFDATPAGAIFLTSIRLSRAALETRSIDVTAGTFRPLDVAGSSHQTTTITTGNVLGGMRATVLNEVEVELQSQFAFPVADDLPRLRIGNKDIVISRFADDGDTHKIIFTITPEELAAIPDGAAMKVRYGEDLASYEWDFGTFEKANIQR